ncbi:UDP-glucose 4-epimerase GalE [Massilimicrobiota sp. An105]|uniref:UDP-glucose 4-epimerase GalE n=1 Tax=Massilimicrobiota sp. An105 TaxID=1965540 RepID=UPI000B39C4B9|nr:UDP-glucose 4-epimerase GalE [Massilimicrobiota sp. An105]OUQ81213.1 UDP-glucose 4-epimerase GalE [Massilimicrobiota sp. An105]
MRILVTGGAGYIGSHTVVELMQEGHEVVIVDNFYNSKPEALDNIAKITGKRPAFYEVDCCDLEAMEKVFQDNQIDGAIHFAGYKAVGESVQKPMEYYQNNLLSTLVLCQLLRKYNCKNLIFSSSATVYGNPHTVPIQEDFPLGPTTNPYGTTKLMIENILRDIYISDHEWNIVLLRYFNPIGAHESGLLGEDPNGIPNNLVPYISKVAVGELECLGVFGNDYDTPDGTGVRDYIHVVDLAKGHVKALKKLVDDHGVYTYNLGTGHGYSVLDIVKAYEKANNVTINYEIKPRRAGDIATCYADPAKAREELGWVAEKTLEDMCKDAYNFITHNKK